MTSLLASQVSSLTRQLSRVALSSSKTTTSSIASLSLSSSLVPRQRCHRACSVLIGQQLSGNNKTASTPTGISPPLSSSTTTTTASRLGGSGLLASNSCQAIIVRSFASPKVGKRSSKKQKKSGQKSIKRMRDPDQVEQTAVQHLDWVNFQRSIAVDGFETGQTVEVQDRRKTRGGKKVRKAAESEASRKLAERKRLTDQGGGLYAPMRYSDEETERLLAMAFAALPERAGKRGTRNLKRQARRWRLVRKIRRKHKVNMRRFQERKMEKRSKKISDVRAVLGEAPELRARDRSYQAEVYRRWAETMLNSSVKDEAGALEGTLAEGEKAGI